MNIIERLLPLAIIGFSGFTVAVADGLIKQVVMQRYNLWDIARNPLMIIVYAIYLFAIAAFGFAFIKHWDLGIIGIFQIIIYATAVIIIGVVFFHEKLTLTHGIGMAFGLIAIMLMNI